MVIPDSNCPLACPALYIADTAAASRAVVKYATSAIVPWKYVGTGVWFWKLSSGHGPPRYPAPRYS